MDDWYEDSWIDKANEMGEEFFRNHRDTTPEDPHDVWEENEITYFMYFFVLWSAQTKFRLKDKKRFLARAKRYRQNIQISFEEAPEGWADTSDMTFADYETYLSREKEYMSVLFKTLTSSAMKAACKLFIDNACKRYIFSEKDLIKIITSWLVNKNIEFQRDLKLGHGGN